MYRIRQLFLGLTLLALAIWPAIAEEATVKISLAEFLKLSANALNSDTGDRSPIPYMFSQGDYRISDQGEWARVESTVSVRVYETGWVEVPLLPSNVLVDSVSLNGKPLTLYGKDSHHTFALKAAGLHTLKLHYYLKLNSRNATKSVTFVSPASSVTNVRVVLQGDDLRVSSSPSIPLSNHSKAGKTVVKGTIPAGAGSVTLSWIPLRADAKLHGKVAREKAKLYGRVYCLVTPGEREVRSQVQVDYTILRNEVQSFRLRVPDGVEVDKVESAHMEDWEMLKDGMLIVRLAQPVSGSHRVLLTLVRPLESVESKWSVPMVKVEGLERIKASVGLASVGGIEVEPVSQLEARPIDVRELPPQVSALHPSPLLLAYEYHKQPQEIVVKTRKGKEVPVLEATVDQAQGATLVTSDGKVCTAFTFDLKNNRRQSMTVTLPEGSQIWSSFVDQKPVKPVKGEDGTIKIPLVADSGTRTIPVRLVYIQEGAASSWIGSQSYSAPQIDIPISVVNWTLYLPDSQEIVSLGGTMSEGRVQPATNLTYFQDNERSQTRSVEEAPVSSYKREAGALSGLRSNRVDNQRMSQMLQETSRGAFPVEVQIPESGQAFHFSQLLVNEVGPTVVVRYYAGPLVALLQILVVVGVLGFGRRLCDARKGWRAVSVLLGLSLVLCGLTPKGLFSSLCLWAAVSCLALLARWTYLEFRRRQTERSRPDAQA